MEEMQALLQKQHCQSLAAMRLRWYHIISPLQGAFSHVKAFPIRLAVSSAISGHIGCKIHCVTWMQTQCEIGCTVWLRQFSFRFLSSNARNVRLAACVCRHASMFQSIVLA